MRLLLIRHGETVHNVAGIYAGVTDSALTNHGVLQANRLGSHLAATDVKISHIFSSDLQRAFKTAEAIRDVQDPSLPETTKLESLREQDFGFYEGKHFFERPKEDNKSGREAHLETRNKEPGFIDVETKESMRIRADSFIDTHLIRLLHEVEEQYTVAVVAHGIILSHLWRALLKRFHPGCVTVLPGVQAAERGFSLEYLGGWSNTGYLELEVKPKPGPESLTNSPQSNQTNEAKLPAFTPSPDRDVAPSTNATTSHQANVTALGDLPQKPAAQSPAVPATRRLPTEACLDLLVVVRAVNSQEHLKGLKKTRGGIGSLKHDSSQKTMDSFFKKRRLE